MNAQDHIEAVGAALVEVEDAARDAKRAGRRALQATKVLHDALGAAEDAYIASVANDGNVVAFSGGNSKPPVDDPDGPIKP